MIQTEHAPRFQIGFEVKMRRQKRRAAGVWIENDKAAAGFHDKSSCAWERSASVHEDVDAPARVSADEGAACRVEGVERAHGRQVLLPVGERAQQTPPGVIQLDLQEQLPVKSRAKLISKEELLIGRPGFC